MKNAENPRKRFRGLKPGAENTEKRVILLKNGAKFILGKEPFRVILPSPGAKNGYFKKKFEEKT